MGVMLIEEIHKNCFLNNNFCDEYKAKLKAFGV